jgi:hypothetical protein
MNSIFSNFQMLLHAIIWSQGMEAYSHVYIINTHFTTTSIHYCLYVIHPINFSNSSHLLHHWSSWQGSHVSTIPWSIILIHTSIFRIWKMLKMYYTSKSVTVWLSTYYLTQHKNKYNPVTPGIQRNNTQTKIRISSSQKWKLLKYCVNSKHIVIYK